MFAMLLVAYAMQRSFAWAGIVYFSSLPLAIVLTVAGIFLAAWGRTSFAAAGTEIIPTSVSNKILVTGGPFRFTRNPMYLGHLVFMLGLAVTFRSYVALALLGLRAIWFHRRVMADEAQLIERFGAEYTDYMRQVRRWVPGLG